MYRIWLAVACTVESWTSFLQLDPRAVQFGATVPLWNSESNCISLPQSSARHFSGNTIAHKKAA